MDVTAPHLTRPLPMLMPLDPGGLRPRRRCHLGRAARPATCCGCAAHTSRAPSPGRAGSSATEARWLSRPSLRRRRPARRAARLGRAARGRRPPGDHGGPHRGGVRRPRCAPGRAWSSATGDRRASCATSCTGADDARSRARAVVNATGVWAGDLADEVRLRPSRGTHLVLRGSALPGLAGRGDRAGPGRERSASSSCCRSPTARIYVGLTDEPVDGTGPRRADADRGRDRLPARRAVGRASTTPLTRADVVGAYAGLRPLLEGADGEPGATADLSRRHAVAHRADGRGHGRRRQADDVPPDGQDAVDAAVAAGGLTAGPVPHRPTSRCSARPPRDELAAAGGPAATGAPLRHRGAGWC